MPNLPLGTLPLSGVPYYSRISSQYSQENKNYYMLGFNPGYALQASELNELQELFFINQSLTARLNSNWSQYGKIPFWDGLIPGDPRIAIPGQSLPSELAAPTVTTPSSPISGIWQFDVIMRPSWFYWVDESTGLGFWIYINQSGSTNFRTISTTTSGNSINYIGFVAEKTEISCCPSSTCGTDQDDTIRDNSSGNAQNSFFTCGASRLKVSFTDPIEIRTSIASGDNFYPIFKITFNATTATVTYIDEQPVTTTN
jgi:hypothetical protein